MPSVTFHLTITVSLQNNWLMFKHIRCQIRFSHLVQFCFVSSQLPVSLLSDWLRWLRLWTPATPLEPVEKTQHLSRWDWNPHKPHGDRWAHLKSATNSLIGPSSSPGVSRLCGAFSKTFQVSPVYCGWAVRRRRCGKWGAALASWWHQQWCHRGTHTGDRWGHDVKITGTLTEGHQVIVTSSGVFILPESQWRHQVFFILPEPEWHHQVCFSRWTCGEGGVTAAGKEFKAFWLTKLLYSWPIGVKVMGRGQFTCNPTHRPEGRSQTRTDWTNRRALDVWGSSGRHRTAGKPETWSFNSTLLL